jgi:hypothetical protein
MIKLCMSMGNRLTNDEQLLYKEYNTRRAKYNNLIQKSIQLDMLKVHADNFTNLSQDSYLIEAKQYEDANICFKDWYYRKTGKPLVYKKNVCVC